MVVASQVLSLKIHREVLETESHLLLSSSSSSGWRYYNNAYLHDHYNHGIRSDSSD